MMKVAVRLDSLVRDGAVPSESKAARIAATASIAGVDSLVAVLPESNPTSWLKPLSIAKTVFDGPFAVACTASQENLDLISKLHPDLVISSAPGLNTVNGDDLDGASIQSFIESLRTRQIPCGVCVSASIGDIKRTRQLDADLVVLPAAPVVNASDTSATVPAIEGLEAGAIAANRLGCIQRSLPD